MSTRRHVEQVPDTDAGSAQMIDAVLGLMPDAAIVADATGLIVAANPGAESMFGYPPGGLDRDRRRGPRPRQIPRPPRRARAPTMSPIPPDDPWAPASELWAKRLDRTEFPADISLAPLGDP